MEQTAPDQRIKELDGWTDHYYEVVDHYYFQKPQLAPKADEKLKWSEPALNHMLNLFFCLAPQDLVDDMLGRLVDHLVEGMRPVRLLKFEAGMGLPKLNANVTQQDLVFFHDGHVIFVEMKIQSKSDVGQFVKYAMVAQHLIESQLARRFHLVMLVPEAKHEKVWKGAYGSGEDLRNAALRGIDGDNSVWGKGKNKAVRKYIPRLGKQELEGLREIVRSIPLTLKDYGSLRQSLQAYIEAEKRNETIERLVNGMLRELCNRPGVKAYA